MAAAIPFVMIAATVASTAYSIYSSEKAGDVEKGRQEDAAAQAMRSAQLEAQDKAEEHRRILGAQRAKYGASGLTFEGTPLIVQFESIKESEEELARILEGGGIRASAYEQAGKEAKRAGTARTISYGTTGLESTFRLGRSFNWW